MSEPLQRTFWQVISRTDAVKWIDVYEPGAAEPSGVIGPEGLVMYRAVDYDAMRNFPLAQLRPHLRGFPEIEQEQAPTEQQVRKAWAASARSRQRAHAFSEALDTFRSRGDDETPDEFYRRVAQTFEYLSTASSTPLKLLAMLADVPKSTAARWVREARVRGVLAPPTRERKRA